MSFVLYKYFQIYSLFIIIFYRYFWYLLNWSNIQYQLCVWKEQSIVFYFLINNLCSASLFLFGQNIILLLLKYTNIYFRFRGYLVSFSFAIIRYYSKFDLDDLYQVELVWNKVAIQICDKHFCNIRSYSLEKIHIEHWNKTVSKYL